MKTEFWKRKFRYSRFCRELYKYQIDTWIKQKECLELAIKTEELSIDALKAINAMYNDTCKCIEKYNIIKNTGRLKRGSYPIKRLRKH